MPTKPLQRTIALYKNAYSGLSRSTWLLSGVMLVNRSGTMVLPFMTIYLTQMGFSLFQAGIVVGLFGAGSIFGGFIGGRATDKYGFYRVQLITLLGGAVLFMVLGLMKSYPLICLFTFILSVVNEAFRPANTTAIAVYSLPENRTRSYSLNRLAINLGWAVGGTIGGFIASFNYHLLFWIDGVTNLVAAVLLYRLLRMPVTTAAAVIPELQPVVKQSAYRDRIYLMFIAVVLIFAACFCQMFSTLPVYYKEVMHLSEWTIGLLMGMNGLIIVCIEMVLVFRLESRKWDMQLIALGATLTGLSFMMLNFLPPVLFAALSAMIVVTFGEIFAMPFMNTFWTRRTSPENRGQYAGMYTMTWSLAQVAGPTGGTWIASHVGFTVLWWITAGLCLLTAILFRTLRWEG